MASVDVSVDHNAPDGPVIHLNGDCDMASIAALKAAGRDAVASAAPGGRVNIDMGALTFLDSSGLGALVAIRNAASHENVVLRLRHVPLQAGRILALTAMQDFFDTDTDT